MIIGVFPPGFPLGAFGRIDGSALDLAPVDREKVFAGNARGLLGRA